MKTITVQIGNSDDKLTQQEWHNFVAEVRRIIEHDCYMEIHFSGGSDTSAAWQNYCMVAVATEDYQISGAIDKLMAIKEKYQQDSIAVTVGDTEFI